MLRLGLLGGMSWQSSALYYRIANELVRERLGGLHSAPCLLYSVDFADIERLQAQDRWADAGRLLADAAQSLECAGAELLLLCTTTMHKVADVIEAAITIPLLHLADPTAEAAHRAGLRRVGLLGTAYTMEQDFYRDRLAASGLKVLIPEAGDRALVHRVIFDELCLAVIREESLRQFQQVIARLVQAGAEGIVLGCTELELLVRAQDSPVPLLPTARLHVEAAITRCLAG
ncbi:MAG: aspartate/glutamate racemase family protein [Streptosporangiaceae bacterium]